MRRTSAFHGMVVMLAVLLIPLAGLLSPQPGFTGAQDKGPPVVPAALGAAASRVLQPETDGECPPSGTVDLPPLSSALHILPPLGESTGAMSDFDRSLTDYLVVTVCAVVSGEGCTPVATFTSEKSGGGLDYIKLQDHHYHVNWKVTKADIGKAVEIRFVVAGLNVGLVSHMPKTNRTVPVKFQIDDHPQIRARVLHEQGYTATEVAQALVDEFGLEALETAWILAVQEGYSAVEVGQALKDVFALDAPEAARILKDVGFTVDDIYTVLTVVYEIDDVCEVVSIFEGACFPPGEYLRYTNLCLAETFAPVLKFDQAASTFPMDAQKWFEDMLCGDDGGPPLSGGYYDYESCRRHSDGWGTKNINDLWNGNPGISTLQDYGYTVPTYFKVESCGTGGQIRIEYWWFYGWQPKCDCCSGDHSADWEHIMVTTSEDRTDIAAVTYYQHAGRYTKIHGEGDPNFYLEGTHPVVYVGKTQHGSYDNHGGMGTCGYYDDWRNPSDSSVWRTWQTPLIDLSENEQAWINYDRTAQWYWGYSCGWVPVFPYFSCDTSVGTHPTVATPDLCQVRACKGKGGDFKTVGCWFGYSDCKSGHCWCGDSRCSHSCWACVPGKQYQKDYWISTSDDELMP